MQSPAEAGGQGFYCDTSGRVPVTKVRTSRGDETFIRWNTGRRGYSPLRRCQEVAARFERQRTRGRLFLTSRARVNGQPVICYTETEGGSCNSGNVLVTLKRGVNHRSALRRFTDFQSGASNRALELSGDGASESTPLELTGGSEDSPPLELSGNADVPYNSSYVTSSANGDYFNLGKMVNDLAPSDSSPTATPPATQPSPTLPDGHRF
jgi:hypothetical protein